ncbi:hypothetical protein NKI56_33760 [Mesorhizobium sp. M0622]|uniref:hypothetical protein n=1 Tax=unclassified Mesorhizobium TaxID=325217 RepID=UPI0033370AA2
MALRIKLPTGTLKVKPYRELRTRERERRVPVLRMGAIYVIWSSNKSGKVIPPGTDLGHLVP